MHLIFNKRAGAGICHLNVSAFQCHLLPVILTVQNHSVMLLYIANFCYYIVLISLS